MRLSKLNKIKAILSCCTVYKVVNVDSADFGKLFLLEILSAFGAYCVRDFLSGNLRKFLRILALKKTASML